MFQLINKIIIHTFTGAQPEIFQGRGGLVGLGHSYKHFVEKTRQKGPKFVRIYYSIEEIYYVTVISFSYIL